MSACLRIRVFSVCVLRLSRTFPPSFRMRVCGGLFCWPLRVQASALSPSSRLPGSFSSFLPVSGEDILFPLLSLLSFHDAFHLSPQTARLIELKLKCDSWQIRVDDSALTHEWASVGRVNSRMIEPERMRRLACGSDEQSRGEDRQTDRKTDRQTGRQTDRRGS
mmetsp:Transcript_14891/g.30088  ORF Transcript_14891/g.30088 Transcript_14891/m.30088 type:complete len:164 (+) Transcript_14891:506-997(+)